MNLFKRIFVMAVLTSTSVLCTAYVAQAQVEKITPDRPGFSTGTFTVPVGTIYLESGYQFSFSKLNKDQMSEVPILTIRTGLSSKTELFFNWNGTKIDHQNQQTSTDLPGFGLKQRVLETEILELTFVSGMIGSIDQDRLLIDPMFGLMWGTGISDVIGHFGGIQFESETDETGREWSINMALGLEFEVHEKWAAFGEYYNFYQLSESDLIHATEYGLLFYPRPSIQLDFYGGTEFSGELAHYLGLGISISF